MEKNNLHKGHRERLRKKFAQDMDSLMEHEILELLLFYAIPRKNTNNLAHILINTFGNLDNVLSQPIDKLVKLEGIGESTALFLNFIHDLCNEYNVSETAKTSISSVEDEKKYFMNYFSKNSDENDCLLLNINSRLEVESTLCLKTQDFLNGTSETKRIADFFIKADCKRVIIGININEPTSNINKKCLNFIHKFKSSFSSIGLAIMDCIICNKNNAFSLKSKNIIMF